MKKILLYFVAVAALFACTPTDSYKISGTYKNAPEGAKVYLAELTFENINYIDTAVVNGGRFELSGRQDTPVVRFLFYTLGEGGEDILPFVLENGNIAVDISDRITVVGTGLNDAMQAYKNEYDGTLRRAETLYMAVRRAEKLTLEQRDSVQNLLDGLNDELSNVSLRHIKNNIGNPIGAFLISTTGAVCNPEELMPLMDSVPAQYRDERFEGFCKRFKSNIMTAMGAMDTAEGGEYANFELKDINGNPVLFSTIVDNNKYTVLDFWASWCKPCRDAMPELKALYEKYGSKGLAVVSLSLDTDGEAWKKAVAELGMTWTQLCNPDGGSREVGQAYGVEAIPTVLVIDKSGKIVYRSSPGSSVLTEKLGELMK